MNVASSEPPGLPALLADLSEVPSLPGDEAFAYTVDLQSRRERRDTLTDLF